MSKISDTCALRTSNKKFPPTPEESFQKQKSGVDVFLRAKVSQDFCIAFRSPDSWGVWGDAFSVQLEVKESVAIYLHLAINVFFEKPKT